MSARSDHFHGIVLTIIATISFVVGTIAFKRYTPKDGLWIGKRIQSFSAGIALTVLACILDGRITR
ncbi:MAG TPA: hypothetical protein VFS63_04290 [Pseudolabrys sp.]|nr:hypothetical protein [Pseudolabrys sp.]